MGRSGVIPGWKIRRELTRLRQQLQAIPEWIWEPRATRQYDRAFPGQLNIGEGAIAAGPEIGLFLIYPRPSLPQSTLAQCRAMAEAGLAPLVISNAPLSEADRAALRPHVWRLVERPNLGHDFGGYRDGLRLLRQWQISPRELLILNDSVWLVDMDMQGLLARLRALDVDVAGSVLRVRGEERFLESYCYLIRGHVLADPAVQAYWDGMVMTSNKYKVIRQGERGHSRALLAAGFRLGAAYTDAGFAQAVAEASEDELRDTLRFAAWLLSPDADAAAAALSAGAAGAPRALIRSGRIQGQFYSLYPVLSRNRLDYPFLKRSSDRVAKAWRQAFLSAVEAGVIRPPAPVVRQELQESVGATGLRPGTRRDE